MIEKDWVFDEDMTEYFRQKDKSLTVYKCKYYPCHETIETCSTCYCPFYEYCQQLPEKIREQYGIQGYWYHGIVWSCEKCTWVHRSDVAQFIQDNKSKLPGQVFTEALRRFGG